MTETQNSFVQREIAHWGEDYVNDLLDRGFWPILVTDGSTVKWVWLLTNEPTCDTVVSGRLLLPFESSAD